VEDGKATADAKERLLALAPAFSAARFVDSKPFRHGADRQHLLRGLERAGLPL